MNLTIIAKQNLTVSHNGKTVQIAKGDKFALYGKVFAYKDMIIDVASIASAFDIVEEPQTEQQTEQLMQSYELTQAIELRHGSKVVKLDKGLQLTTASDIVFVKGAVLDLSRYSHAIKVIDKANDASVPPTPVASGSTSGRGGQAQPPGPRSETGHALGERSASAQPASTNARLARSLREQPAGPSIGTERSSEETNASTEAANGPKVLDLPESDHL